MHLLVPTLAVPPPLTFAKGANCKLLLHCDGTSGSTSFPDSSGLSHTVTPHNSAQVSTAQSKFGGASLLVETGTTDYLTLDGSSDFNFASNDFTIDFWFYLNTNGSLVNNNMFNNGAATTEIHILTLTSPAVLDVFISGIGGVIIGGTTLSELTWYHCALTRAGNDLRLFLNGTQESSTYDATGLSFGVATGAPFIGVHHGLSQASRAHIDEYRIVNGTADWTANFTPNIAPYS